MLFKKSKEKVFCIGRNKTGTTSIKIALKDLGYKIGDQLTAERLIYDWSKRKFKKILKYCESADAFQDIPFSLDYTFQAIDQKFPNSKFVLTVRNSPEEWYSSLKRFHSKLFGIDNRLPTEENLKNSNYNKSGWILDVQKLVYGYPEIELYNRKQYIKHYEDHNNRVIEYFKHRKNDLLILNISTNNSYKKLCKFLNVEPKYTTFPWYNKS